MIKTLLSFFLLCLLLFLGACTGYRSSFSCKPGKGIACKKTSDLVEMQMRGELADLDNQGKKNSKSRKEPPLVLPVQAEYMNEAVGVKMQRTQEETLQVWIAPFLDERDVFWGEQTVNLVVKPAKWAPPKKEAEKKPCCSK